MTPFSVSFPPAHAGRKVAVTVPCASAPPQGALYCLLGNHSGVCLANLHDWECIALTWPAVVRSGLSSAMSLEKPSIVRLFDDLADKIHRQYETIGIDFSVGTQPPAGVLVENHSLVTGLLVFTGARPFFKGDL